MSSGIVDSTGVFRAASQSFLNSLPPKERAQFEHCYSSDDLLKSIGKVAADKGEGRLRVHLKKVRLFSERLEPYFETIGIIVQSHPEFAALAWGALRLVLQV
jgi:hypothetical protein